MWDMSTEHERIASFSRSERKDASGGEAGAEDTQIPTVKWRYASAIEFSVRLGQVPPPDV